MASESKTAESLSTSSGAALCPDGDHDVLVVVLVDGVTQKHFQRDLRAQVDSVRQLDQAALEEAALVVGFEAVAGSEEVLETEEEAFAVALEAATEVDTVEEVALGFSRMVLDQAVLQKVRLLVHADHEMVGMVVVTAAMVAMAVPVAVEAAADMRTDETARAVAIESQLAVADTKTEIAKAEAEVGTVAATISASGPTKEGMDTTRETNEGIETSASNTAWWRRAVPQRLPFDIPRSAFPLQQLCMGKAFGASAYQHIGASGS